MVGSVYIYLGGRGNTKRLKVPLYSRVWHGTALSSRRAFLSGAVFTSSPSALRFSAAPLDSGAGVGTFLFFFTTIDVRSFTGRS